MTRTTPPPDGQAVILYDGSCQLCTAQAGTLEKLAAGQARAEALENALERFPGLSEDEARREIKFVAADGRVYGGAEAIVKLVNLGRPRLGKLLYPYYLPGIRQLSDRLYAWVARNRYRLFGTVPERTCHAGSCSLHAKEEGGETGSRRARL